MSRTLIPLKLLLRTIPDRVHSQLFSRICTQLVRGQPFANKLVKLQGKVLQLTFTDTGNCWRFKIEAGALTANLKGDEPVDIHVQGSTKNFLLLATHNEDPDTLFFNQELSLEGNTEDGLYLRNVMDAMEFDTRIHLQNLFGQPVAEVIAPLLQRANIGTRLQALGRRLL